MAGGRVINTFLSNLQISYACILMPLKRFLKCTIQNQMVLFSCMYSCIIGCMNRLNLCSLKCANDEVIRNQIFRNGAIEPLVALLNVQTKPEILLPVTGAIWRLASSTDNLNRFQEMNVVALLIPFLTGQPEQVCTS